MGKEPHRWDLIPCTVLNPGPSILLGKALKGGTDTWLSVDSTALSLRSLSSGNGRDEQRNLTLRLWQGGSLKLSEAGSI